MIVVSPIPKASTEATTRRRRTRPSRSQGSASPTDQHSSQLVSANVAGLRSETGPVTAPPVATRATTCTTIVASSSHPAHHSTRFTTPAPLCWSWRLPMSGGNLSG
jgi:hypothetical protein